MAKRPLWAPWRIEYLRRLQDGEDDECFLCRNASAKTGDDQHFVIARGRWCYALLNRYPYNSGHLLIAPYRHLGDLPALRPSERHELFDFVTSAEIALRSALDPQGFNLGCNIGGVAGAALEGHVHFHLVPRWSGDTNFMPVVADVGCVPQALAETAALLRRHWPGPKRRK